MVFSHSQNDTTTQHPSRGERSSRYGQAVTGSYYMLGDKSGRSVDSAVVAVHSELDSISSAEEEQHHRRLLSTPDWHQQI